MKLVQTKRLAHYGATSAISEPELVAAHMPPSLQARPCVCGTAVIADPRDPTVGVQLHQDEHQHVAWRERLGL